jgi:putative transposase
MEQPQRRVGVTSRRRLRGYDYAEPAFYFVTLCTEGRLPFFGEVQGNDMMLSPSGEIVSSRWETIPTRFPSTAIDAFVVMPNHLHGILLIQLDSDDSQPAELPSLSRIIQWFKSITTVDYTRGVKHHGWPAFPRRLWQPGFHDHIVRNDRDLERIRAYIDANPATWAQDDFNV